MTLQEQDRQQDSLLEEGQQGLTARLLEPSAKRQSLGRMQLNLTRCQLVFPFELQKCTVCLLGAQPLYGIVVQWLFVFAGCKKY